MLRSYVVANQSIDHTVEGPNVKFPSEFRVETLDPPFMFRSRPTLSGVPEKLAFGKSFTVNVTVPGDLDTSKLQGKFLRSSNIPASLLTLRLSLPHGPRLLLTRVPFERTPGLPRRAAFPRQTVAHVYDATKWACVSAGVLRRSSLRLKTSRA